MGGSHPQRFSGSGMDFRLKNLQALVLLFFGCGFRFEITVADNVSSPNGRAPAKAMILPLLLSSSGKGLNNSSRAIVRRLAEAKPRLPVAGMRLYDELLTDGYYTTRLWIGTPPQEFALIVDSGSTVTYVPCSTCTHCGNHQDPKFQPEASRTYRSVKCGLDCSNCDIEKNQCRYERHYAEMSTSNGVLGEDLLSFGEDSELRPQRGIFGCEDSETGDLYNQRADGIIGLGRGQLSIMDQLVQKGVISDSFSLCYGGMDIGGGSMILGSIAIPPAMVFSKSDPNRSPYYNIQLKGIRVAGDLLPIHPQVFNARHGTVMDSGTTYAYLPERAFIPFRDAVIKKIGSLHRIPGPDPSYHDICFSGAGSDVSQLHKLFPSVELVFGNKKGILLAPENYLFRHSKVEGAYCLGIFQNGKDLTTLLGGIVVRNMLVTYDRGNQRIGFWKINCSELRETLPRTFSSSPFAPKPQGSPGQVLPLAPPPPELNLEESRKVGGIELYVFLTVNIKVFEPLSSEFINDMARELEVPVNQIHILNATGRGDTSAIGFAVYPSTSSDFMTNETAERIISLLSEHKVHLRDAFGTYQLHGWGTLPTLKRTWIRRHLTSMIGSIVGVLVISVALLLYWHFRRQKQEVLGNYRTVEAVNQEEELQQL